MKRIVCYGDSNTWGCRPDNNERYTHEERWPKLLGKLLGDDYEVIEEGHCGRTTVWTDPVECKMSGMDYLTPCMETHAPFDLLLIMLGTNDCKERYSVNAETIAFGLGQMIRNARFAVEPLGPRPEILIVSPPCISEHYKRHPLMSGLFGRDADLKCQGLPKEFSRIAEQYECHFFDASTVAHVSEIDGIHLDYENGVALAQGLHKCIKKIFEE